MEDCASFFCKRLSNPGRIGGPCLLQLEYWNMGMLGMDALLGE